jgi:hypothetical protein
MAGHSLVDKVTGDLYDMNTLMMNLQRERESEVMLKIAYISIRYSMYSGRGGNQTMVSSEEHTVPHHSSEQETHEQSSCHQQEDDEDTDEFIQGAL